MSIERNKSTKLIPVMEQLGSKCKNCICSVCLIAETNGGAQGCGNCESCDGCEPCTSCSDFYSAVRLVPVWRNTCEGDCK